MNITNKRFTKFLIIAISLTSSMIIGQEKIKEVIYLDSLFFSNKKLYYKSLFNFVNSERVDYEDKCIALFSDYLSNANTSKIKNIYSKYFEIECGNCYDKTYDDIFFAYIEDQRLRYKARFYKNSGNQVAYDSIIKLRRKSDRKNIKLLMQIDLPNQFLVIKNKTCNRIIDNYFILVQHSNLLVMEKNIDFLDSLRKKGVLSASKIALLSDRIRVEKKLPQIYGTQLIFNSETGKYELYQLENEAQVNIRRKNVGLGPLEDYLKQFGVIFQIPSKP